MSSMSRTVTEVRSLFLYSSLLRVHNLSTLDSNLTTTPEYPSLNPSTSLLALHELGPALQAEHPRGQDGS
uniref:Uncharacterized protein n=1 Tax=Arundo donax TaxID=35708 RepID=A0A0A9HXP8_ARUDO